MEVIMKLFALVGVCAFIARFLPNRSDNKAIQFLLTLVNFFGQNGGPHAKNE